MKTLTLSIAAILALATVCEAAAPFARRAVVRQRVAVRQPAVRAAVVVRRPVIRRRVIVAQPVIRPAVVAQPYYAAPPVVRRAAFVQAVYAAPVVAPAAPLAIEAACPAPLGIAGGCGYGGAALRLRVGLAGY